MIRPHFDRSELVVGAGISTIATADAAAEQLHTTNTSVVTLNRRSRPSSRRWLEKDQLKDGFEKLEASVKHAVSLAASFKTALQAATR